MIQSQTWSKKRKKSWVKENILMDRNLSRHFNNEDQILPLNLIDQEPQPTALLVSSNIAVQIILFMDIKVSSNINIL
jgi:hypothetical protein